MSSPRTHHVSRDCGRARIMAIWTVRIAGKYGERGTIWDCWDKNQLCHMLIHRMPCKRRCEKDYEVLHRPDLCTIEHAYRYLYLIDRKSPRTALFYLLHESCKFAQTPCKVARKRRKPIWMFEKHGQERGQCTVAAGCKVIDIYVFSMAPARSLSSTWIKTSQKKSSRTCGLRDDEILATYRTNVVFNTSWPTRLLDSTMWISISTKIIQASVMKRSRSEWVWGVDFLNNTWVVEFRQYL